MAWYQTANKALFKSMVDYFTDAYMRHPALVTSNRAASASIQGIQKHKNLRQTAWLKKVPAHVLSRYMNLKILV